MQLLRITRERFEVVHKDISDGSEPALRFYLMVAVSTLIAAFGLISNSTAVVIGAMLVAPLMTPIFGISLALVRGEPKLLGHALRAEIVGVAAAVTMGFMLGSSLGEFEPTSEMLARTRPNLWDLFVAVLAGFAGAYALVDEKISPALPGVAIATAIVPPLANSGLCLSLGEVRGGLGSFLLFSANFVSILLVAAATFVLSGMAKRYGVQPKKIDYVRRFGVPVVAFVLIAAFLGHSLYAILMDQHITRVIKTTLIEATSRLPATTLREVHHYTEEKTVHVMASIYTPKMLAPTVVSRMQDRLTQKIGMPTELITQCVLANNVSALGQVENVIKPNLDGSFVKSSDNAALNMIATTEQTIREYLTEAKGLYLIRVELMTMGERTIILAQTAGIRRMTPIEIERLEARVRQAAGDDSVELLVGTYQLDLQGNEGAIRYGWIPGEAATPEIRARIGEIRKELMAVFGREEGFELINVGATFLDGELHFLLEIIGPEVYSKQKVDALKDHLNGKFPDTVNLYAWTRIEVVQGPQGLLSVGELRQYFNSRQRENLPEEFSLIVETSD